MRQKSVSTAGTPEKLVRDIRRATRKQYSAEEKIRIVLDGLRGESSIAELCRRENIAESLYYSWLPTIVTESGTRAAIHAPHPTMSTGQRFWSRSQRDRRGRPCATRP